MGLYELDRPKDENFMEKPTPFFLHLDVILGKY